MAEKNIFDSLQESLADAVKDIREKVVEEPMWGRTLSESSPQQEAAPTWPEAKEQTAHTQNIEQERQQQQEQDIER